MPINSRNKGASAERQVAKLIYDHLGVKLKRNLEQTRSGGHDLVPESPGLLDDFAIEIKRYAKITKPLLDKFWEQAIEQAENAGKLPILIFRGDREEWRVAIALRDLNAVLFKVSVFNFAILEFVDFCEFVRER